MTLIYHTFFKEFRGTDAESLIRAVHDDAEAGTGLNYPDWWAYQQKLWQDRYDLVIPDATAPDAPARLLAALIHVGALEQGPLPPRKTAAGPRHG